MEIPRVGTGYSPPGKKKQVHFLHTAVLKGIAVFFYSTFFLSFPPNSLIHNEILLKDASALWRVRFFNGEKRQFLAIYRPRSPPIQSRFQKIRDWRNHL